MLGRFASWILHKAVHVAGRVGAWRTFRRWVREAGPELFEQYDARAGFEERLRHRWANGLDGLELLRLRAYDEGAKYNERHRPDAATDSDFVFDALSRLHARACRAASEVGALLRAGHAEGAHARWRTLHEVAVTMFFIRAHGRSVAEAYLAHHAARAWSAAEQYQRYHADLGYAPFAESELDEMRAARDSLAERFGPNYVRDYGWSAAALGKSRVTFQDIEEAVNMDRWRPWYRMASEGQHAGSRGLVFTLGLLPDANLLLAGPSNAGLEDPGASAAISLAQATVALLTRTPDFRSLQAALALLRLSREVEDDFHAAAARLDDEEDQERRARDGTAA